MLHYLSVKDLTYFLQSVHCQTATHAQALCLLEPK